MSRAVCAMLGVASVLMACSEPSTPVSSGSGTPTLGLQTASERPQVASPGGSPTAPASASAGPQGTLIIEQRRAGTRNYTEGSIAFVKISRGDTIVTEERLGSSPKTYSLPPGWYVVNEYQRPCDGTCGNLDAPTDICTSPVEITAGASLRAVATVRFGEGCSMTIQPDRR